MDAYRLVLDSLLYGLSKVFGLTWKTCELWHKVARVCMWSGSVQRAINSILLLLPIISDAISVHTVYTCRIVHVCRFTFNSTSTGNMKVAEILYLTFLPHLGTNNSARNFSDFLDMKDLAVYILQHFCYFLLCRNFLDSEMYTRKLNY